MGPRNGRADPVQPIFHVGEIEAHRRFDVVDEAEQISDSVVNRLSIGVRRFIEAQPFFFMATTDASRQPRCNIVWRTQDATGGDLPLLKVIDSKTLMFPVHSFDDLVTPGQHVGLSSGIGLLFVDFARQARYRINGRAKLQPDVTLHGMEWPAAGGVLEIAVEQAYANCGARVVERRAGESELAVPVNPAVRDRLTLDTTKFIASQCFFFVATANAEGDCDCSYKGREQLPEGGIDPLLLVLDAKTVVLPDYKGNNMFNTIGNLIVNAGISLLFVDLIARARFRVNGQARIIDDATRWAATWPGARRYIEVTIDQAYFF